MVRNPYASSQEHLLAEQAQPGQLKEHQLDTPNETATNDQQLQGKRVQARINASGELAAGPSRSDGRKQDAHGGTCEKSGRRPNNQTHGRRCVGTGSLEHAFGIETDCPEEEETVAHLGGEADPPTEPNDNCDEGQ